MSITTKQQTVSAKWAGEILDRHYKRLEKKEFIQRPITQSVVERYASDMKMGTWALSPQPITFDENGDLIDGQHRLEAVRISGKDIEMMVSTGWPVEPEKGKPKVINVIDMGKTRTVSQMMHLNGMENARSYVACAKSIARVAWLGSSPITTYSTTEFILMKLNMKTAIDKILSVANTARDFKPIIVGPLAFYYSAHPVKAVQFADEMFNHTTQKGSPIQIYYRWRDNLRNIPTHVHIQAVCAAVRHYHNGTPITVLRPTPESVEWLATLNHKLRDQLRAAIPRTR